MKAITAVAVACLLSLPAWGKQVVLKGYPFARVVSTPDTCYREVLDIGQRNEFMLLVSKDGEKYVWETRAERELVLVPSGG